MPKVLSIQYGNIQLFVATSSFYVIIFQRSFKHTMYMFDSTFG